MTAASLLVELETADALRQAVERLRNEGLPIVETYTPYPVSGDGADSPPRRLPTLAFAAAALGAALGYGIQWYVTVRDYPLNVGGRPLHSVPAFIPVAFETLVLAAALAAFMGFLMLTRLPALWHPVFEVDGFERASADRYWVEIGGAGGVPEAGEIRRLLAPLHPLRVVRVEREP